MHKTLAPIRQIFDQLSDAYKKRVISLTILQIVFLLAIFLGTAPIAAATWYAMKQYPQFRFMIVGAGSLLGVIVFAFIGAWIWAAMIAASMSDIGVKEALAKGRRAAPSFFLMASILCIFSIGGMFLFLLPVICVFVWFSLAGYILVAEGATAVPALSQSRAYVRGHFLSVLARLFVVTIVGAIISAIPVVGQFLASSFYLVFMAMIYEDIRACSHPDHATPSRSALLTPALIGLVGILYIPILFLWKNDWKLPELKSIMQKMGEVTFQPAPLPGGFVSSWGSKGKAPGKLDRPSGIAVEANGTVYICDQESPGNIQKFTSDGRLLERWDKTDGTSLFFLVAVAVDRSNRLHISDPGFHKVFTMGTDGRYIGLLASSGIGADGKVNGPSGLAVDRDENVFVADTYNKRVQKFKPDGTFLLKIGMPGGGEGQFESPVDVATDGEGRVWVADADQSSVQVFASDGNFLARWGKKGENAGELSGPSHLVVDSNGYVYVGEAMRLQKFDPNGTFIREWKATSYEKPEFTIADLAVDPSDNVLVLDSANGRVMKLETSGSAAPSLKPTATPQPLVQPAPPKKPALTKKKVKKRKKR